MTRLPQGVVNRLPQVVLDNAHEVKIFAKFSVVGTTGALVDLSVLTVMYKLINLPLALAIAIGFIAAVVNNYTWNILWTYSHQDHSEQHHITLSKFIIVSMIGLAINEVIVNLMTAALSESFWFVAKLVAMGVVLFWNFTINRVWTFKE
ncbi:MAG: GtrA family protein [Chloroflexota bacterium]